MFAFFSLPRHLIAPVLLLLSVAAALSACREPVSVVEAAQTAPEAAVLVNGRARSAIGAFTVDAMTIETRYWNSSANVAYDADAYRMTWREALPSGRAAVTP